MPKFTNTPSLDVSFTFPETEYSYSGLELSSLFTDEGQLQVLWVFEEIIEDGIIISADQLEAEIKNDLIIIPATEYTVDEVTSNITIDLSNYTRAVNGKTYTWPVVWEPSPEEPMIIRRAIEIDNPDVVFQNGSRLTSAQLNRAVQQNFLSMQELYGQFLGTDNILEKGTVGPQGPTGPAGTDGADGADGTNGTNGAPGPKGDTGDQGPKGDTGDQGPAGTAVSSVVSLPIGRAVWNSDTTTIAPNSFVRIFDSSHFPSASAVSGMGLTGDFSFTASSGTWGFVAPEDGNYSFSFQGSIGYSTGTLEIRAFGNWQVNSVNVTGETLYNYDDSPVSKLFPMTDTCVLQLSAGDRVSYQLSAATGSGTLSFRYGQVDVTQLTFDAALAGGITLDTLKAESAASTDFADFQARIAAL